MEAIKISEGENVVVVREIPYEEVKKEVEEYLREKVGDVVDALQIANDLKLSYELVHRAVLELVREGKAKYAEGYEPFEMESGVVILMHEGGLGLGTLAIDVLVKEEYKEMFKEVEEDLYRADCEYVKKFLEENKGYVYLGSEDFAHIDNTYVAEIFNRILRIARSSGAMVKFEYMVGD